MILKESKLIYHYPLRLKGIFIIDRILIYLILSFDLNFFLVFRQAIIVTNCSSFPCEVNENLIDILIKVCQYISLNTQNYK